ncbi:RHE_PE00001 family protein [Xanthobacteraceae bacterium A53D]
MLHLLSDLPWTQLAGPMAEAEDALARLDERLRKSPVREGWSERTHYMEACAALWLEGELAHLEDLVLHDARMDIRSPTHELTRAHAVLRARRRIAEGKPDWALSAAGLASLSGRTGSLEDGAAGQGQAGAQGGTPPMPAAQPSHDSDELDDLLAAVDLAVARTDKVLASGRRAAGRDPLVYDLDWDEDARLADWRTVVEQTRSLPATLAAAIAMDAWAERDPLQHAPWLGRLLGAALLRQRGKCRAHLPCLHGGLKALPRERHRPRERTHRLVMQLETMTAAAEAGLKDHDRWLTARDLLARKAAGGRSSSRLPALVDYVLMRPIVSAGMIAAELGITPRAAQDMVRALDLSELTGRGRYRAWGVR